MLIELYVLNKIVLFTILHFKISVSIRLAYLKQFSTESSDFWKQLIYNNFYYGARANSPVHSF